MQEGLSAIRQALPEGEPGNNERWASLHQSGSAGNTWDPDADEDPGLLPAWRSDATLHRLNYTGKRPLPIREKRH
jgi:hypothetical protein